MATTFLQQGLWRELTSSIRKAKGKADVAVAYFGDKAGKQLPLGKGSRLVVDASEGAVKSGQTCPAELIKLYHKGVAIYSVPNLHAKVYVVGRKAYVGSANASRRSANTLVEAMLVTSEASTVKAARAFIDELTNQPELGVEELQRLGKLYVPPRVPGGKEGATRAAQGKPALPRFWVARVMIGYPPEEAEDTQKKAERTARSRMDYPRRHVLDEFHWERMDCPYELGDVVMQVVTQPGKPNMVMPPSRIVLMTKWEGGSERITFFHLEMPNERRINEKRFIERMGAKREFKELREGRWSRVNAERLMSVWKKKQ